MSTNDKEVNVNLRISSGGDVYATLMNNNKLGEDAVAIGQIADYVTTAGATLAASVIYEDGTDNFTLGSGEGLTKIEEGTVWTLALSVTGGTVPYTVRMVRERDSYPTDYPDIRSVDGGWTFGRNGGGGNTGSYTFEITDAEGFSITSESLQLEVLDNGGGSGGGTDEGNGDPVPELFIETTATATSSGDNGAIIANDVATVQLRVENIGSAPATAFSANVAGVTLAPTPPVTLAIGETYVGIGTYTITQIDANNGLRDFTGSTASAEIPTITEDARIITGERAISPFRVGIWGEDRNALHPAYDIYGFKDRPVPSDWDPHGYGEPVVSLLRNSQIAHVKAKTKADSVDVGNPRNWVVNIINEARALGSALELALVEESVMENFDTDRFGIGDGVERYKAKLNEFAAEPETNQAIIDGVADGTVAYIFTMDEPNHTRWKGDKEIRSPKIDLMAQHVGVLWPGAQTITRTSAVNLLYYCGDHVFQHLTHAYLTISSTKWRDGNNLEDDLEAWLNDRPVKANQKVKVTAQEWNSYSSNDQKLPVLPGVLGQLGAYKYANLKAAFMVQAGFKSVGDPNPTKKPRPWPSSNWWKNGLNLHTHWEDGTARPSSGRDAQGNPKPHPNHEGLYMETSPWEMEWWIKSLASPRNDVGILDPNGVPFCTDFVYFRGDRAAGTRRTSTGENGIENWFRRPHIVEHFQKMKDDLAAGNLIHTNPDIEIGK